MPFAFCFLPFAFCLSAMQHPMQAHMGGAYPAHNVTTELIQKVFHVLSILHPPLLMLTYVFPSGDLCWSEMKSFWFWFFLFWNPRLTIKDLDFLVSLNLDRSSIFSNTVIWYQSSGFIREVGAVLRKLLLLIGPNRSLFRKGNTKCLDI